MQITLRHRLGLSDATEGWLCLVNEKITTKFNGDLVVKQTKGLELPLLRLERFKKFVITPPPVFL